MTSFEFLYYVYVHGLVHFGEVALTIVYKQLRFNDMPM